MLAASAGCAGCGRPGQREITSCASDLNGVYIVEGRPDERWSVLDPPTGRIEMYPLFDDTHDAVAPRDREVGPRVVDVARPGALDPGVRRGDVPAGDAGVPSGSLVGTVTRRYMRGVERCDATASVTITACAAGGLELVIADPVPPTSFAPCAYGPRAPARREHWHRER